MIVDTFTGFRWSHFYETNNGMIKPACKLFQKWKDMNIPVKIFKSDNAGKKKGYNNGASVMIGGLEYILIILIGTCHNRIERWKLVFWPFQIDVCK